MELHKRTLERGLLSLIGPDARRRSPAPGELAEAEHANARCEIDGDRRAGRAHRRRRRPALRRRRHASALSAALRARGAAIVSEQAAECLRVEHGRPRYGIDLDDSVIPQEAGLNERAVSFTKGCYVGQETVARLHYKGKPNRHLRGLRLSEPAARARSCASASASLGRVGSVAALPHARTDRARAGAPRGRAGRRGERRRGRRHCAEVVELPFRVG